jgi:hypothetical protein
VAPVNTPIPKRPRRQRVVLEEQMIKMTDARMNYDAAIGFYQKSMDMLKMAVAGAGPLRGRRLDARHQIPVDGDHGGGGHGPEGPAGRMRVIAENMANANSTSAHPAAIPIAPGAGVQPMARWGARA